MKSLRDPDCLLTEGLAAIRQQFKVPATFPPPVLEAAEAAARRSPSEHADRTAMPFVTLDPATSTDLDQAFTIEAAGSDLLLHYAIADVPWFVADGDALDTEAWLRGETMYLPDGKAGLYPPVLAEHAASLLPDGPRPCFLFTTRVAPDGAVRLEGVERALIRSRAKLAYDSVRAEDVAPQFDELARRIAAAENARGAARIDPPEQEVERDAAGHFTLRLRPLVQSEVQNAALSLATNLAVADALYAAGTGLFRVMAGPDARAVARLRYTAAAFGLSWPGAMPIEQFERSLDPAQPAAQAFMLAIRKAGDGASYVPYQPGVKPWHAAMAATYCHMTAPLRRLADRYVLRAAHAIANGQPVPLAVNEAFQRLPAVMAKADARASQIDRAVIDLAETATLAGREGETFAAVITDLGQNGARIQLCDAPVVARVDAHSVLPGGQVRVRLDSSDPIRRELHFTRVS
ncbi:RNB domain-containing ribonuclease [Novosphingobium sp. B 225]|uniref:RNB domain-containing ribonuclease n=1 Tax=Novosphingobium sp. B 225 TaxID=1961849 RepID=UPI000B4A87F6|nr:RNB domain-containing ribonuclease [Novosphingobium sp. B 225]